jgi:hypothetical protein
MIRSQPGGEQDLVGDVIAGPGTAMWRGYPTDARSVAVVALRSPGCH